MRRAGLVMTMAALLFATMPATVTRDQATHFAESVLRGQPKGLEIARHALGEKIHEMV